MCTVETCPLIGVIELVVLERGRFVKQARVVLVVGQLFYIG